MTNTQAILHLDRTANYIVFKLKVSSPQELRRFLASPLATSLLLPEERDELYTELQTQEGAPRDRGDAEAVEVGRD